MFSIKLVLCCIVALHFISSGASPVQETNAVQSAELEELERYAATERSGRALYVTVSSQAGPASYVSGGMLYVTITASNIISTVTISDRPTQSARFVAHNGRLGLTITGSNTQTRVNYNGTPNHPAIDFMSVNIVGSNARNSVNVAGSSVTASGSLRISASGSNNVNSVIINDRSLRPADRRLQISLTGANNENRVIVNGSPRLIF